MNGLIAFEAICGIVQCVFMSAIIVNLTDKKRFEKGWVNYVIAVLCLGTAGTYNTVIAPMFPTNVAQISTTVLTFGMFIAAIGIVSRDSIWSKVRLFLLTAIVPSIAFELLLELYVTLVKPGGLSMMEAYENVVYRNYLRMLSMTICICYSVCLIVFHNRRKFRNTLTSILMLVMVPVIQLTYLTIVFRPELVTNEASAAMAGGVALFFSSALNLLFLRLIHVSNRIYAKEKEQQITDALKSMNRQYYEIVHEEANRASKIRHDIGNQLEQIEFLVSNGNSEDAQNMLKELKEKTDSLTRIKYCDNMIINSVLTLKYNAAQRDDVEFVVDVNIPSELKISDLDLSSSLSNLIDNAMREACKVDGNRSVKVSIGINDGKLIIRTDNPVESKLTYTDIESIRKLAVSNSTEHGYGLRILEDIAERNNGEFFIEIKERICTAIITLEV